MKQLLLDLNAQAAPTLDSFVIGQNAELHALLCRIARRAIAGLNERFVYIWGEAGAGKTHLLRALAGGAGARYIGNDDGEAAFHAVDGIDLYLIDDCDRLAPDLQIRAFDLFNQVRERNAILVTAGSKPPLALTVRDDLRTRLGWGLIYQLHGLSDDEKIAALEKIAQARGLVLPAGVLPYLMTHFRRDMPSLSALIDALDRYSLETKRPITLPLLRDLLQQQSGTDNRR